MVKIVTLYHSGYGHTKRMAESVAEGIATIANVDGQILAIDADGNLPADAFETLKSADAILFGSPTYMGSVSWQFKKFADASSKAWFTMDWKDKIAAGFTNSGLDERRQAVDAALHVHARHAARHDLGRHRHDAVQQEGFKPQRPQLCRLLLRRDGRKHRPMRASTRCFRAISKPRSSSASAWPR